VIRLNESVALLLVEPLHRSCRHETPPSVETEPGLRNIRKFFDNADQTLYNLLPRSAQA
jgi:hypothetical protein